VYVTATGLPHAVLNGEERAVARQDLERMLGPVPPGVDEAEYVGAYLRHHGIEAAPGDGDVLVLRRSPRMAVIGAATLTIVFALFASAGRPLYGVIMLALCGIGIALVARRYDTFAARLPRWIPRGRMLGVVVVLPFLVVAGGIDVVLRHNKTESDARLHAIDSVRRANQALDGHDLTLAVSLVTSAEAVDPHAPGVLAVRKRLLEEADGDAKQLKSLQQQVAELQARVNSRR
jgi:hypothetical protein